tara:strand:- start:83797 stop:86187 length:2391 start_codon:yes stop_codon:yes gene_type:complete
MEKSARFLSGDFFKLSDNLIAIINTEGWFVEINPACSAIVGYSEAEIIGKSVYHFAHPDDLSHVSKELSEVDRSASSRQIDYRWHCKDGSWTTIRWDIQLIPEASVLFVIGREVVARNPTQISLEEATNTLDTVIESIPAMIFMKSASDLRFVRFNQGGERLLGISREDLLGKNDYDLFTKEQADSFTLKDQAVLNSHQVFEIPEEPIQTSSGDTIYLRTSKVALRDADGTPTHLLGISIDITDRRNAELQLRQVNDELSRSRADAEQANRAKSDFLAKMSHEIRTPMNGVIGMTDVLRESRLNRNQMDMVDLIQNSALSLLRIIDDILDFSKIEAGHLDIDAQPINLIENVESVCVMLNNLAQVKNVSLTVFADPDLFRKVMGDSLRLRQILINLINNAIKFSSQKNQPGRVSVRATVLEKSATQLTVEFLIEDNGIGMDKDTQARLFTPFMQKDAATSSNYGGTGLGLVITRNLVDLMEGEITVQSELHQGSSFRIKIPFSLAPAEPVDQPLASELDGLSCLLIGDDEGDTTGLATYLHHAGASVERVNDITAAETRIKANNKPRERLWIIDTETTISSKVRLYTELDLIQNMTDGMPILVVQRGVQYKAKDELSIISIDGNAMSQSNFIRVVAQVARRQPAKAEPALPSDAYSSDLDRTERSDNEFMSQGPAVLIAEDSEINQKVILHQLELLGYTGHVADNGRQALERWRQGNYALLLTDLQMPDMDGYELCDAIRAEETESSRIPIILLTANVLANTDEHYTNSDIDGYLSKPARLEELQAIIETWIKQKN